MNTSKLSRNTAGTGKFTRNANVANFIHLNDIGMRTRTLN